MRPSLNLAIRGSEGLNKIQAQKNRLLAGLYIKDFWITGVKNSS